MLNYKLIQHKSNPKLQHFNHFSQVKLPNVERKAADPFKKSMSKIKSSKLPLLNFHVPPFLNRKQILTVKTILKKVVKTLSYKIVLILQDKQQTFWWQISDRK